MGIISWSKARLVSASKVNEAVVCKMCGSTDIKDGRCTYCGTRYDSVVSGIKAASQEAVDNLNSMITEIQSKIYNQ